MDNRKRRALILLAAVSLCVLLAATAFAFGYLFVEVRNNYFHTGTININLNDQQAVIQPGEFLFEPGATVSKEFFLENTTQSTDAVYYRFYVDQVQGDLEDHLEVTIQDRATGATLARGKLSDFQRRSYMDAPNTPLAIGEKRWFTIFFHMPDLEDNRAQGKDLTFRLNAIAVQSKNNDKKEFN